MFIFLNNENVQIGLMDKHACKSAQVAWSRSPTKLRITFASFLRIGTEIYRDQDMNNGGKSIRYARVAPTKHQSTKPDTPASESHTARITDNGKETHRSLAVAGER